MNRRFALSVGALAMWLAGCGGPSATFDIGQPPAGPEVSARQVPLHIPPDYALRPGDPESQPVTRAPRQTYRTGNLSPGEGALLSMAGAGAADPRIRALIDRESTSLAVVDPLAIERLVFGTAPTPPPGLSIRRIDSRIVDDPLSLF
ncbi:MAG: DUF3035 domain-containing protein [Inquilinus sp.]|nr:DUF3035 domain-containing protein [Inquilinus sp.]